MDRPPIIIEKVRNDYQDSWEYRINVDFGRGGYHEIVRLPRHMEIQYSRPELTERLLDMIRTGIANAVMSAVTPDLIELNRRTGDFDNTTELGERDRRAAMEHLMSQAYNYHNHLSGLQGMTATAQAMRQQQSALTRQLDHQLDALAYQQMVGRMNNYTDTPWGDKPKQSSKDKKAMKLLASKIGYSKMRQLKKKGYFEEPGRHGTFRFHMDTQGGVSLLDRKKYGKTEREVEWTLCVQSMAADLPKGDVILSRWMEWKADEDKFLDTANFRSVKTKDEATQGRI